MKFTIIGAGIGGLTTAIALKQKGFEIEIFEQAAELKPVGAGILLAGNAMQVYKKLGLYEKIAEAGNYVSQMTVTKGDLEVLSSMDNTANSEKTGVSNIAIHRGALQQILVQELEASEIHCNKKLEKIERNEQFELTFTDGTQVRASYLIGADGINSAVRNLLFAENTIRKAKQLCWRGVLDFKLPTKFQHQIVEMWGSGRRFGFVQISKESMYWFAVEKYKNSREELEKINLEESFSNFAPLVGEILAATPKATINVNELTDLKPISTWFQHHVCLLGDAAHATTPNMGQGACQAIESAFVLSECLSKKPVNEAFKSYQSIRQKKARMIVKTSWMVGSMAHWTNPIGTGLRNFMLKITPNSVNEKQVTNIYTLEDV